MRKSVEEKSVIGGRYLKAGEEYGRLPEVCVIIITPFDPFGMDRMVYTMKTCCEEAPELSYEDGARTIYLYTKGTVGNPPDELKELLRYMERTTHENAVNRTLEHIDGMVEAVKGSEVEDMYLTMFESGEEILARGIKQGREEGRESIRRSTVKILNMKGSVPDGVKKELDAITEEDRLNELLFAAIRVHSIEEFEGLL